MHAYSEVHICHIFLLYMLLKHFCYTDSKLATCLLICLPVCVCRHQRSTLPVHFWAPSCGLVYFLTSPCGGPIRSVHDFTSHLHRTTYVMHTVDAFVLVNGQCACLKKKMNCVSISYVWVYTVCIYRHVYICFIVCVCVYS